MSITAVVAEVLEIRDVPVQKPFFDLGANSAALVRIYRRLRDEQNLDFPLIAMFEHPSIRKLASFLDTGSAPLDSAATGAAVLTEAGADPSEPDGSPLERAAHRGRRHRAARRRSTATTSQGKDELES